MSDIDYGDVSYWESRYAAIDEKDRFDWLQDYITIKPLLHSKMPNGCATRILNVGCGNGIIQEQLYKDGFTNIINNDISQNVINLMRNNNVYQKMEYHVMDVTEMKYHDNSFDFVFDKSTIDALLCSSTPSTNVAKMVSEVYRTLVVGGVYFVVSYGAPCSRMVHLQRPHVSFQVEIHKIYKQGEQQEDSCHFIYICTKKEMDTTKRKLALEKVLAELAQQQAQLLK